MLIQSIPNSRLHCCLFILILFILIFLTAPLLLIYLANSDFELVASSSGPADSGPRQQDSNLGVARLNMTGGGGGSSESTTARLPSQPPVVSEKAPVSGEATEVGRPASRPTTSTSTSTTTTTTTSTTTTTTSTTTTTTSTTSSPTSSYGEQAGELPPINCTQFAIKSNLTLIGDNCK